MTDTREGGALFKARDKRSDKAPDWKGDVTYNGVKMGIAAWERTTRNGDVFLSVKLEPYREKTGAAPASGRAGVVNTAPPPAKHALIDDEIPF